MNGRQRASGLMASALALLSAFTVGAVAPLPSAASPTHADASVRPGASASSLHAVASVKPGITVLLEDSLQLIRGKRIGLLTNQTGIDELGRSDIDLLRDPRAREAGVQLVRLFSPEHGIRGTEDHEQIASGIDAQSGLPVISLYGAATAAPPDSLLRDLDAIVIDLQDIGTRTWTYVGAMLYTMESAARLGLPCIVLDRPNPITGTFADGPLLDSALANPLPPAPGHPGKAYALYPVPLRHGMTMAEMARFFDASLRLHAPLHVVPMSGWTRGMWFDQTGLPWVRPSPNMPDLTSALLYPSLVPFEGSNLSVGRGTSDAFQRFGAPWLDAPAVASLLTERRLAGVRFVVDSFTPRAPGDDKFDGLRIPGVRIVVTARDSVTSGELGAAILWAVHRTSPDSLRISARTFDERLGSSAVRIDIQGGADPAVAMRPSEAIADDFERRARAYWLYR